MFFSHCNLFLRFLRCKLKFHIHISLKRLYAESGKKVQEKRVFSGLRNLRFLMNCGSETKTTKMIESFQVNLNTSRLRMIRVRTNDRMIGLVFFSMFKVYCASNKVFSHRNEFVLLQLNFSGIHVRLPISSLISVPRMRVEVSRGSYAIAPQD